MLRFPKGLLWVLTAVLGGAVGAGIVMLRSETRTSWSYAAEERAAQVARSELVRADDKASDLKTTFQTVAKAMRPSVVSISTIKHVRASRQERGRERARPQVPEQFRDFFGDQFPFDRFFEMPDMPEGFDREGLGSGVIVSPDGYILTNNHVVRGADEVNVTLSDRRTIPAKVVGTDPRTDLAVIKVEATGLIAAPLGNSDAAEVGEWVLAVGSPFGLDQTVTAGIISAKGRQMDIADYEDFIQTDAAINPGNSGGPLLDSAGRLIGISTAIYSPSGASAGIGFAVPVDTVNRVVPQLIRGGKYIRPTLGIEVDDGINQRLANVSGVAGVFILRVPPESAAARAGLKGASVTGDRGIIPGDIITAVNGKAVDSVGKLFARLDDFAVGDVVKLTVLREGRTVEVDVTLQPGGA